MQGVGKKTGVIYKVEKHETLLTLSILTLAAILCKYLACSWAVLIVCVVGSLCNEVVLSAALRECYSRVRSVF